MKQMSRHDARIKAFQLVFMLSSCDDIDFELDNLKKELKEHKKHFNYISEIVKIVYGNVCDVDAIISQHIAEKWNLDRISKMSLAILRLATGEIKYMDDIPVSVSINEAVELSKEFCDENEISFINGILGEIAK